MSAFGFHPKDEVVSAIEELAKEERLRGKTTRQIVESIMEATAYGIDAVLYNLSDEEKGK